MKRTNITKLCCVLCAAAPIQSFATVLYSTSFEEFQANELLTTTNEPVGDPTQVAPNTWFYTFGNEATVTTSRARTGSQAVVIDKANSNLRLAGPWSAPILDFEYSYFIDGPSDSFGPGTFNFGAAPLGPFRFALSDGTQRFFWPGSATVESFDQDGDGTMESLRVGTQGDQNNPSLNASVEVGQWYKVNLLYDTVGQTMELRYDDESVGTVPMANSLFGQDDITEFPFYEIFTLNTPDHTIYIDDFSITAIPEPSSLALLACAGAFVLRRRR
jgi:hypothetical protein